VNLVPDDEPQLRRLLRLLAELGDGAGANRAYQTFAERIASEFDATPAPETQALIATIRSRTVPRERSSARVVRPDTVGPMIERRSVAPAPAASGTTSRYRERWGVVVWLAAGLLLFTLGLTALGR